MTVISLKKLFRSSKILYSRGLALPSTVDDPVPAALQLPRTDTFVTSLGRSVPSPPPNHDNGGQTN